MIQSARIIFLHPQNESFNNCIVNKSRPTYELINNMNDEVKPWDRTGYRFVKRQTQTDQNVWVQIGDPTTAPDYVSR